MENIPECCGFDWKKAHATIGRGADGNLHRKGCPNGPATKKQTNKRDEPPCLVIFPSKSDISSEYSSMYRCGLHKGHDGGHAWRADLPGGPVESIKA